MDKKYTLISFCSVFLIGVAVGRYAVPTSTVTGVGGLDSQQTRGTKTNLTSASNEDVTASRNKQGKSNNSELRRKYTEEKGSTNYSTSAGGSYSAYGGSHSLDRLQKGAVKEFVRSRFENEPDFKVVEFLQNYVNINSEDIPEGIRAADYAVRLGEIFAAGVNEPLSENNIAVGDIEFGTAADENYRAVNPHSEFRSTDYKIYASFNTANYMYDKVLVKFYSMETGKVYLFDIYDINKNSDYNWVFVENKKGWPGGDYKMKVYTTDLEVLSSGEYYIPVQ